MNGQNLYENEVLILNNTQVGTIIIIGGAEDKKGEKTVLNDVCDTIDKQNGVLVIATVATDVPKETANDYKNIFKGLGVKNIDVLDIKEREDAYFSKNIDILEKSSLVFFTGGDQLKITSLLGGTPLYTTIKSKFQNGCIFAGTSAGASAMSEIMIVSGFDEESPKKGTLKMSLGLGLIEGVMIDQHFAQRGRIGRLLTGIAQNPQILGIGIDEDTAIVVKNKERFHVIGSGAVYVIDGSSISHTNVSQQNPEEVLSIFDIKMHVLKKGDKFDLIKRIPFEDD